MAQRNPAFDRTNMSFPKHNVNVYISYNEKGTRYYAVSVAGKYIFYFNSKKNLVEIDDLSTGTWDVYSSKADRDWWLNLRGSRDVYEKHVLPCLEMFIKRGKKN